MSVVELPVSAERRASRIAFDLRDRIIQREATIGIVGMGYVGQPLAIAIQAQDFDVIGFDVDRVRVNRLNSSRTALRTIGDDKILRMRQSGKFRASSNFAELEIPDVIVICVPTPLNKFREPDLSYVRKTAEDISATLRPGQLVCLESTSYPGTTADILRPLMESTGYKVGRDVFLAFSPEREDPGNEEYGTADIPKVVGADDEASRDLAEAFYGSFAKRVVRVSSTATAEAVKLTENIFRCVNIALVNELKHVYGHMGIDLWEVIEAASTKPFGFMPFYPGPGVGGHCIPVDPFYLSWKARENESPARFIELAGEINSAEPLHVVSAVSRALSMHLQKSMNGARVLLLGLSYKKNVDDIRESPALVIMRNLEAQGCSVRYFDPWIPVIPTTREYAEFVGRRSIEWNPKTFRETFDAAIIVTDHDSVDYQVLVESMNLVVDTRNATRDVQQHRDRIVMA